MLHGALDLVLRLERHSQRLELVAKLWRPEMTTPDSQFRRMVQKGTTWKDEHGAFRVIVVAEGYAMCRRKYCGPFLRHVGEFAKYIQLTRAEARNE